MSDSLNSIFLYDCRIGVVQSTWFEPFHTSFCSLDHDGLHAILGGSKLQHVCLFDDRSPGKCVQIALIHSYNTRMSKLHHRKFPIASLVCDSRYAFLATDSEVQVLDYKRAKGVISAKAILSI